MNGGDMSLADVLPAVRDSLTQYWGDELKNAPKVVEYTNGDAPSCDGGTDSGVLVDSVTYCPSTNTIAYDQDTMAKAHDQIGDFASGVLLATEWSSAVLHGTGDNKAAECLTGAYTSSLDSNSSASSSGRGSSSSSDGISLSPGDLDEVVAMLVAADSHQADRGTAFNRVAAFRTGFFRGANACQS
jgi:hypothetical protein